MHWMTSFISGALQFNLNFVISALSLSCCRLRTCGYVLPFWSLLVLSLKELQKIFNSIIICEGHNKHYTILCSWFERFLSMLQVSSKERVECGILRDPQIVLLEHEIKRTVFQVLWLFLSKSINISSRKIFAIADQSLKQNLKKKSDYSQKHSPHQFLIKNVSKKLSARAGQENLLT